MGKRPGKTPVPPKALRSCEPEVGTPARVETSLNKGALNWLLETLLSYITYSQGVRTNETP